MESVIIFPLCLLVIFSSFTHGWILLIGFHDCLHLVCTECGRQRSKTKTLLLQRCALRTFHLTDGQNTSDKLTSDRRSKRTWLNCVLCIPFILSGSPNESWLHTSDACVITTWILGLRFPLVACSNKKHSRKSAVKQYWAQISLVKNSKWQWPYSFNAQCRLANSKYFSSQTTSCKIQFQLTVTWKPWR